MRHGNTWVIVAKTLNTSRCELCAGHLVCWGR